MPEYRVKPLGHRVLVKPDEVKSRTAGGLFLPDTVRDMEKQGTALGRLIAIGITAWKAFDTGEPWAAVGDHVFFAKYGGQLIKTPDNQEFRVLNDEDLTAKLETVYQPGETQAEPPVEWAELARMYGLNLDKLSEPVKERPDERASDRPDERE